VDRVRTSFARPKRAHFCWAGELENGWRSSSLMWAVARKGVPIGRPQAGVPGRHDTGVNENLKWGEEGHGVKRIIRYTG